MNINNNRISVLRVKLKDITKRHVSSKQLIQYFYKDINKISNVELKRLRNSFLSTKSEIKRQAINVLLQKRANHHYGDRDSVVPNMPQEIKQEIEKSFFASVLNDSPQNLLRTPEEKEILQHFACYGVALVERLYTPKSKSDAKKVDQLITRYVEWVGSKRSAVGKSGLQAQILHEISKQQYDLGYKDAARTQLNHAINLEVEKHVNNYLSNFSAERGYRLPNGALMTSENINQWLTIQLEEIGESEA